MASPKARPYDPPTGRQPAGRRGDFRLMLMIRDSQYIRTFGIIIVTWHKGKTRQKAGTVLNVCATIRAVITHEFVLSSSIAPDRTNVNAYRIRDALIFRICSPAKGA